jgi:hypothetical protein
VNLEPGFPAHEKEWVQEHRNVLVTALNPPPNLVVYIYTYRGKVLLIHHTTKEASIYMARLKRGNFTVDKTELPLDPLGWAMHRL